MGGFLSGKRTDRVVRKRYAAISLTGVSMLFVCCAVTFSGCKRRPKETETAKAAPALETVVTNRMLDPVYRKALEDNRREQTRKAAERQEIVGQMEKMIAEVRAVLPAGADNEAVKAELAKRPGWKALEERNERAIEGITETLAAARETVRKRMEAEARDIKAVAEGRAVPAAAGSGGGQ